MTYASCELCSEVGGEVLFRNDQLRVVLIDDANYPGFCRVIWNAHIKEMTDLPVADRMTLMNTVWQVEAAQRDVLQPFKINVASLGNMVPHLHWHLIPRFTDDAHFPSPIWAPVAREIPHAILKDRHDLLPRLRTAIVQRLTALR